MAMRGSGGARAGASVAKSVAAAKSPAVVKSPAPKRNPAREKLIAALNEDLAGELGAIVQYITYAAKTTGPFRPELSQFFLKEVPDEQAHAQFLANKIVALGGEPTTAPRPVPPAANNREMLMAVLEAERRAKSDYTKRARQAEAFGDKGLQVHLENIIADESGHFEETERILRDWPM